MHTNAAVVATASLLLLALTGCSAAAAVSTQTPTASATPTPVASGPLSCDDLVPADLVAATLEGADGVPVEPVAAVKSDAAFESVLLEGVGGLACSWRVGSGMPEYNGTDWAYLRMNVLPGAAAQWQPFESEGRPSTDTRQVAGIEASVSGGDPGWAISAPVGDSWVHATISAAGLTGSGSRFGELAGLGMIDRLVEVAASAFTAIQQADGAQLDWPPTVELRQGEAICNGGLDEQGIVAALQLPADATVEYMTVDATATPPERFDGALRAAARTFDCELRVDGSEGVTISTARGFGPLFDRLGLPDNDVAFAALELVDAPAGTQAVVTRYDDGRATVVLLAVGDTLYQIRGDGAQAVAQAIVHQTY